MSQFFFPKNPLAKSRADKIFEKVFLPDKDVMRDFEKATIKVDDRGRHPSHQGHQRD